MAADSDQLPRRLETRGGTWGSRAPALGPDLVPQPAAPRKGPRCATPAHQGCRRGDAWRTDSATSGLPVPTQPAAIKVVANPAAPTPESLARPRDRGVSPHWGSPPGTPRLESHPCADLPAVKLRGSLRCLPRTSPVPVEIEMSLHVGETPVLQLPGHLGPDCILPCLGMYRPRVWAYLFPKGGRAGDGSPSLPTVVREAASKLPHLGGLGTSLYLLPNPTPSHPTLHSDWLPVP